MFVEPIEKTNVYSLGKSILGNVEKRMQNSVLLYVEQHIIFFILMLSLLVIIFIQKSNYITFCAGHKLSNLREWYMTKLGQNC